MSKVTFYLTFSIFYAENNLFLMAKRESCSQVSSLVEWIKARFDFQPDAFHKTYKNIPATLCTMDLWFSSSCTLTCGKNNFLVRIVISCRAPSGLCSQFPSPSAWIQTNRECIPLYNQPSANIGSFLRAPLFQPPEEVKVFAPFEERRLPAKATN